MLHQQTQPESIKIRFEPTFKQHLAWTLLMDQATNEVLFGGGAGGGKTTLALAWLIIMALQYPGSRWVIGRKELKRLKQSILPSLFGLFRKWGMVKGRDYIYRSDVGIIFPRTAVSPNDLESASAFIFLDMSYQPADPQYDRFGSLEFTGAFIEEGQEVEQKAKEVLFSRIRYMLKEFNLIPKLLITCNPSKNWLYNEYYRPAKEGKLEPYKAFIQSLVTDNPHISPHYIESLRRLKDRILKERLLNGNWEYEESDLALFIYDKILDLFSNTIKQPEKIKKYLTCDAARFGNDKAVITLWHGLKAVTKWEYAKSATTLIEDKIREIAATEFIPMSQVIVDEEGVGGGIVDHLKCKGFVGSSSAIDRRTDIEKERRTEYKLNYRNLRAQCFHKFAEMTNDGLVAITINDESYKQMVIEEAEQIRRVNPDSDTKFQIIPKDEIKLAIGRSPDYLDTLMMRFWFEVNPERHKGQVHYRSASEAGF